VKRALVTGSAGFVGRHFQQYLEENGWLVLGCDILDRAVPVDCRTIFDGATTPSYFDLVVHCAAIVGGRAKIDGDPLALADNLAIDQAAFRWAIRAKPAHFVYFSSSAAYPVAYQHENASSLAEDDLGVGFSGGLWHPGDSWPENPPWVPDNTYGLAKLVGEMLAERARSHGLKVHVFRPFSGYGSDQSVDYPFPSFIDRAIRRENPFEIWGDGNQVRDFVHIDDIVSAVMAAIEQEVEGPVNVGSGRAVSFRELARLVTGIAGYEPELQCLSDKPTGVQRRVADVTKLHTFYTPRVTLEEGIARALDRRSGR
jgi:nucleoside-diphosphate-sugar epimerase